MLVYIKYISHAYRYDLVVYDLKQKVVFYFYNIPNIALFTK